MKVAIVFSAVLVIAVNKVLGSLCPRTNEKPGSVCVDECQPSFGCTDSKKECLCDGDCGYSCVKKGMQCSPLKKLRNGRITGNDRTFNSTMTFQCNPKYTLFGASIRRCRAKGLWDGKKSRCKISCPDPGIPDHTNRNRKLKTIGFSEGTTLRYDCLPGYQTTDSLSITCQNDKQWSSLPPVCTVQQCGKVSLPANSKVRLRKNWRNKPTHKLGTKIWLSCNAGYRSPVFFGMIQCGSTGWQIKRPGFACSARSCGNPGVPRNGKKSGLSYTFNDVVHYSCNNCYELAGSSYRQCLADGTWSGTLPTCEPITCPTPTSLAHATLRLSSQPIHCGSYVDYKCSIGYNLKGRSRLTCLGDGSWSYSKPTCEIVDCGDPGNPPNGQTTAAGGFTYGNDITFSCNQNFVLEGSSVATCQSDGTWSMSLPKCLEKCSDPSGNTNAHVIGKKFYHSNEVEFICPRDSILVPSRSRKLTCQDGEWQGTIPSCKASCPPLPRLSDGSSVYARGRSRSRTHGSVVQFRCTYGHKLVGSSSRTCNDGTWSNQMPRCLAICRAIPRINYGSIIGRGNLEGAVLRFSCRTDYVLDGARAIRCTGNRRWNATIPACRAPCAKIRAPTDGSIRQGGFRHNERRHFECRADYYLQGSWILTCVDGRWSDSAPTCLAPCSRFSDRPFFGGYRKRDGFRHNEEVVFGCNDPLVLDGQGTLRCNNGRWSDRTPSCAGPCRNLAAPTNGFIANNGYKHKETLIFQCRQGFQMVGEPRRICNFGVWSDASIPRCEAKCSNPRTNARVVGNEFYHGKKVKFLCPNDEVLDPELSKELTCNKGKWSGMIPWCKASCPPLPLLPNGKINGTENRKHGSLALFVCNAGYQQTGASLTLCNNGKWSDDLPRCLATCRKISSITNGRVIGKGNLEGDKVRFVCDPDYIILGEEALRCTSTGAWNASEPLCKRKVRTKQISTTTSTTTTASSTSTQARAQTVTRSAATSETATPVQPINCADIKKIRKGKVLGTGVIPGSKRTFSCYKKWRLSGPQEITCLNNGQWSGSQPICVPEGPAISCSVVGKIENGFAIVNQTFHGGRVVFQCYPNYILKGKPSLLCRSGKWSRKPPKCYAPASLVTRPTATTKTGTLAPCKKLGPPKNGSTKQSGVKHGAVIGFSCNPGYTLKGVSALQCFNGSWDARPPTCFKAS